MLLCNRAEPYYASGWSVTPKCAYDEYMQSYKKANGHSKLSPSSKPYRKYPYQTSSPNRTKVYQKNGGVIYY